MKPKPQDDSRLPDYMKDLRDVGPSKPLGYLPDSTIAECGLSSEEVRAQAAVRGLATYHSVPGEGHHDDGFTYVYDRRALAHMLKSGTQILESASWPIDPDAFVRYVDRNNAAPKTELFDLIADIYADTGNPNRLRRPSNSR